mgnify:CR=1 FL=1
MEVGHEKTDGSLVSLKDKPGKGQLVSNSVKISLFINKLLRQKN